MMSIISHKYTEFIFDNDDICFGRKKLIRRYPSPAHSNISGSGHALSLQFVTQQPVIPSCKIVVFIFETKQI